MVPRKQAGHMTCTRPQAERQILLAMRASSTHDPYRKSRLLTNGRCYVAKHPPVPPLKLTRVDRRVVDHGLVVDVSDGEAAEIVEGTAINSNRAKHLSGALSLHPGNAMPTRKGHTDLMWRVARAA